VKARERMKREGERGRERGREGETAREREKVNERMSERARKMERESVRERESIPSYLISSRKKFHNAPVPGKQWYP
jgi:hypothetical protein